MRFEQADDLEVHVFGTVEQNKMDLSGKLDGECLHGVALSDLDDEATPARSTVLRVVLTFVGSNSVPIRLPAHRS